MRVALCLPAPPCLSPPITAARHLAVLARALPKIWSDARVMLSDVRAQYSSEQALLPRRSWHACHRCGIQALQAAPLVTRTAIFERRDVQETTGELRLLLCREKKGDSGRKSTSVVTACGIFINDVLDAVPIDKYFEMFKPGTGFEGGFIRLKMKLLSPEELKKRDSAAPVCLHITPAQLRVLAPPSRSHSSRRPTRR